MELGLQFSIYFNTNPYHIILLVCAAAGITGLVYIFRMQELYSALEKAAGIWLAAALGLLFGAGLFREGMLITLLIYAFLKFLNRDYQPGEDKTI
ncbi:MAG: MgtC/SapB family protein [Calditrichia bacterium]